MAATPSSTSPTTAIEDFAVDADILRLADLLDENDDGVTVGSALDGDVLIGFSGGGSVELQGVQSNGATTLADLAQLITIDFG